MKKRYNKSERSWILYDFANSTYATTMLASIFPIYFTSLLESQGKSGDALWGYATSIATASIAILVPILGSIGDYKNMKKKLLTIFLILGVAFTVVCGITDSWQGLFMGYIFSYIGFLGANLFYDSMLVDVTTNEKMDEVSALGFSMGYIGGSTIPFVISILIITFASQLSLTSVEASKIAIMISAVWWSVFSIPILLNCKQKYAKEYDKNNLIKKQASTILNTVKEMVSNKAILFFILGYFFYIDGVNTVINMATAYGTTLKLDQTGMILALLVTQLVAFPFTIIFGKLSKKHGPIKLILSGISMYFVICCLGFFMGFGLAKDIITLNEALLIFWLLAVLVGTVQGGIQALSRSFFGKIIPQERSSEYFGVFDIFGKFAAVLGPFIYAFISQTTGKSYLGILSIISLFFIGGTFILIGRKHFKEILN